MIKEYELKSKQYRIFETMNINSIKTLDIDFNNVILYNIPKTLYHTLLTLEKENKLPTKNIYEVIKKFSNFFTMFWDDKEIKIHRDVWYEYFSKNYTKYQEILFNKPNTNTTPIDYIVPKKVNESWYSPGEYAKSYKANQALLAPIEGFIIMFDTKPNNISKYTIINPKNIQLTKEKQHALETEKLNLSLVVRDEIEYYNRHKNNSLWLRLSIAYRFNYNQERKISQSRSGRIFTPFTNITRIASKHLSKYYSIDLSNSQPLMLVIYAIKNNLILDDDYIDECLNATIYNKFYYLFEQDKDGNILSESEIRDITKVEFFKCIYYDYKPKRKINIEFTRLYPLTAEILKNHRREDIYYKDIKDDLHFSLANKLQNIETFFLTLTTKYSKRVFDKHDAIYFSDKKDMKSIIKQINKIGKQYNITLPISVEEPYIETQQDIQNINSNDTSIECNIVNQEEKDNSLEETLTIKDYEEFLDNKEWYKKSKTNKLFRDNKRGIFDMLVGKQLRSEKKIKVEIAKYLENFNK